MGGKFWRICVLGLLIGLLLLPWGLGPVQAQSVREFLIITGEWSWKAKSGEAPVVDRDRGAVKEIERYTFDPPFLVVNKGDTVVLHVHALKGEKHLIEIKDFGVSETPINKGEEKTVRFVADKAGIFKFVCNNHVNSKKEGPMVGYIYVMDTMH